VGAVAARAKSLGIYLGVGNMACMSALTERSFFTWHTLALLYLLLHFFLGLAGEESIKVAVPTTYFLSSSHFHGAFLSGFLDVPFPFLPVLFSLLELLS
jgi:uncharacterized membrane protein YfcA